MKNVYNIKELCLSCHQCEVACAVEHAISGTVEEALSEVVAPANRIHIQVHPRTNAPYAVKCRHCNPAPCIPYCPTGALKRDFSTGFVIIDEAHCSGCRACESGCQFGAIQMVLSNCPGEPRPVAVKCDGCVERIKQGLEPACVASCSTGALVYSSLDAELKSKRRWAIEKGTALQKRCQCTSS